MYVRMYMLIKMLHLLLKMYDFFLNVSDKQTQVNVSPQNSYRVSIRT